MAGADGRSMSPTVATAIIGGSGGCSTQQWWL